MKHYSKEFKEEALKLSDEIGVKKAELFCGHLKPDGESPFSRPELP